jgi:negative regulator of sigma E activity
MNSKHLSDQEICLYVDALKLGGTEHLPHDIVEHVSDCLQCKREIMQLYDAVPGKNYQSIGEHPFLGAQQSHRREWTRLIFRMAAAIVVLIAAGVIAYFAFIKTPHELTRSTSSAVVDTTAMGKKENAQGPVSPEKKFAANFTPSPNMEDLVGANLRSTSISVESPKNGQSVTGSVVFRWKSEGSMLFKVRLLTNAETEVFQATTDRPMVQCDKRLDPGLYYWTLQEDGELVHVGKFTVPLP